MVENDNLQLRRMIHELERMRVHARYRGQPGPEELVGHPHSQQMGHKEIEGELLGETGVPGMDEIQQEMAERNGENILKMMKRWAM